MSRRTRRLERAVENEYVQNIWRSWVRATIPVSLGGVAIYEPSRPAPDVPRPVPKRLGSAAQWPPSPDALD